LANRVENFSDHFKTDIFVFEIFSNKRDFKVKFVCLQF
jgi:hypothetical protein